MRFVMILLFYLVTVSLLRGPPPVTAATVAIPTQITVGIGSDFTAGSQALAVSALWKAKAPQLSIGAGDYAYGSGVSAWCTNIWKNNLPSTGDGLIAVGTHDTSNPDVLTNDNTVGSVGTWEGASGYAKTCGLTGTGINWVGSGVTSTAQGAETTCVTTSDLTNVNTCFGREGYFDYPTTPNPIVRFIVTCDGINSQPGAANWCDYASDADATTHFNWLDGVIASGRAKSEWIVVINHVENWNGFEGIQYSDKFWNHMITDNVDLLIMAGNHDYERSFPLTCQKSNSQDWFQDPVNTTKTSCIANTNTNQYNKGQGLIYMTAGDAGQAFHLFCQKANPTGFDIAGNACSSGRYTDWKSNNAYFAVNNDTTWGFNYLTIQATGLQSTYVNCTTCDYTGTNVPASSQNAFTDTFTIGTLLSTNPGSTRPGCGACTPVNSTSGSPAPDLTFVYVAFAVFAVAGSVVMSSLFLVRRRR